MIERIESMIGEYQVRAKKLLENVKDAGTAENLANYELGRLHGLNKVISELELVLK